MKKDVMEQWVKALRSGDYKQGQGRLRSLTNKFCCLGVLCDISKQGRWKVMFGEIHKYIKTGVAGSSGLLPSFVLKWSGVKSCGGEFSSFRIIKGEKSSQLISLNDNGWSFKKIANFIEKYYKEL